MVQTCVNSENGLGSRFRLQLRPHFINLNEIFRKCGYDTNQNFIFNAIFIHMNQLGTNGTFQAYENFLIALQFKEERNSFFPTILCLEDICILQMKLNIQEGDGGFSKQQYYRPGGTYGAKRNLFKFVCRKQLLKLLFHRNHPSYDFFAPNSALHCNRFASFFGH